MSYVLFVFSAVLGSTSDVVFAKKLIKKVSFCVLIAHFLPRCILFRLLLLCEEWLQKKVDDSVDILLFFVGVAAAVIKKIMFPLYYCRMSEKGRINNTLTSNMDDLMKRTSGTHTTFLSDPQFRNFSIKRWNQLAIVFYIASLFS